MRPTYGSVPGLDVPMPRIIVGTDRVQTRLWRVMPARRARRAWLTLFDAALDMGCTAFDTACSYRGGDAELLLGRWLAESAIRHEVIIVTKGGMPRRGCRSGLSAEAVTADLETSLRRLRRDSVDLYLLHRDDADADVVALVEMLASHHRAGKIKAYGFSNWDVVRVASAVAAAHSRGLPSPSVLSPQMSLASWRVAPWKGLTSLSGSDPEARRAREWVRAQGLAVFAYSPLGRGFFGLRTRADLNMRGPRDPRWRAAYDSPSNFACLARAQELGRARGATAPEIALAYVLGQPCNTFAVVGVKDAEKLAACVSACRLTLTASEMRWLETGVHHESSE
jgi:aryl-alcohol dehydrogenase-like predicted oxidoreductase